VNNSDEWLDRDGDNRYKGVMTLMSYTDRNQAFVRWIKNPAMVSKKVCPEALDAAQVTGPDTVYRFSLGARTFSGTV
jgi:hypothetical protein